jgi:hypothetical protein
MGEKKWQGDIAGNAAKIGGSWRSTSDLIL